MESPRVVKSPKKKKQKWKKQLQLLDEAAALVDESLREQGGTQTPLWSANNVVNSNVVKSPSSKKTKKGSQNNNSNSASKRERKSAKATIREPIRFLADPSRYGSNDTTHSSSTKRRRNHQKPLGLDKAHSTSNMGSLPESFSSSSSLSNGKNQQQLSKADSCPTVLEHVSDQHSQEQEEEEEAEVQQQQLPLQRPATPALNEKMFNELLLLHRPRVKISRETKRKRRKIRRRPSLRLLKTTNSSSSNNNKTTVPRNTTTTAPTMAPTAGPASTPSSSSHTQRSTNANTILPSYTAQLKEVILEMTAVSESLPRTTPITPTTTTANTTTTNKNNSTIFHNNNNNNNNTKSVATKAKESATEQKPKKQKRRREPKAKKAKNERVKTPPPTLTTSAPPPRTETRASIRSLQSDWEAYLASDPCHRQKSLSRELDQIKDLIRQRNLQQQQQQQQQQLELQQLQQSPRSLKQSSPVGVTEYTDEDDFKRARRYSLPPTPMHTLTAPSSKLVARTNSVSTLTDDWVHYLQNGFNKTHALNRELEYIRGMLQEHRITKATVPSI